MRLTLVCSAQVNRPTKQPFNYTLPSALSRKNILPTLQFSPARALTVGGYRSHEAKGPEIQDAMIDEPRKVGETACAVDFIAKRSAHVWPVRKKAGTHAHAWFRLS